MGDNILPYDEALAWIPLSSVGFLGVYLFFLVSGYVISLTLQSTPNLMEFGVKRVARLWPTLLVCGSITFLATSLFGPPELKRSISEALISMTLFPPQHVGAVTGNEGWMWLDGAYWSLWVEVRFYVIIGLIYYIFQNRWLQAWLAFTLIALAVSIISLLQPSGGIEVVKNSLFADYVPMFTVGILAFRFKNKQTKRLDLLVLGVALLHGLSNILISHESTDTPIATMIGYVILIALFGIFVWRPNWLVWMEHKHVLRAGRSSYAFYLLHQVVGISILVLIGSLFGTIASLIALPFVLGAILFLSISIFEHIEQPANRWIVSQYKQRSGQMSVSTV